MYKLCFILRNFADFEEDNNNLTSSKKHYEEALEIERELPETPLYLNELANTLRRLAMLEEKLGNLDSAKIHYQESLNLYIQLENEEGIEELKNRLSECN